MKDERIEENEQTTDSKYELVRPEFPQVRTGIKAGDPNSSPDPNYAGYEFWLSRP